MDAVGKYVDMGYRAIRAQSGVPGIEKAYGDRAGRDVLRASRCAPADPDRLGHAEVPQLRAQAVREAAQRLRLRARGCCTTCIIGSTPNEAAQLGKALEAYRLFWMEDATPAENQEAFRHIRRHTTTPLAVGEVFNTIWDCKQLIEEQLIDYIRCTVVHAGGITHLRRIADLAALYQIRTGSHGATDLSPVCMGAALHFDTWVPNFGIQEYMRHTEETDAVFPHDYRFEDGHLLCGETPGHGVEIDEKLATRYPTIPPVCRSPGCGDGTLWNW